MFPRKGHRFGRVYKGRTPIYLVIFQESYVSTREDDAFTGCTGIFRSIGHQYPFRDFLVMVDS